ncbi:MAG: hypothetical protein JNK64_02235 [Myxococcales bacterium]|nr:hypothetical protein [Myxococcales bacterium]
MSAWDAAFERACHALVEEVCAGPAATARERAWQRLLIHVAPHVERWAARSPALRRTGLTGEDEPRAVLVDVIDRLCDRDFAALRRYLAYQRDAAAAEAAARDEAGEHDEAGLVDRLARLAGGPDDPPATPADADADVTTGTPLRGWLLLQTRFVIKDHVKQRLGWRAVARWAAEVAAADGAPDRAPDRPALVDALAALDGVVEVEDDPATTRLVVRYRPARIRADELERVIAARGFAVRPLPAASKRDATSGADRLDDAPERGERPPLSTLLGVRQALTEITAHIGEFPPPMQAALRLWLDEAGFDAIAAALALPDARAAQALVRAAQARLRARFRGAWPELFG